MAQLAEPPLTGVVVARHACILAAMCTTTETSPGPAGRDGPASAPAPADAPGAADVPGPWNPGLRSPVPSEVMPLVTLFRPENAFASLTEVLDLADFTGLAPAELVAFRPARLVDHELLIRVAADISVPDGPGSEDLGVNFRAMASRISEAYLEPHAETFRAIYGALREEIETLADAALADALEPPRPAPAARGWLGRLVSGGVGPTPPAEPAEHRESAAIARWRALAAAGPRREQVLYEALARIVGAVRARHARVLGDRTVLVRLVADRVCNVLGGELLGRAIEPHIDAAIDAEGFRRLPAQERPVVMNTKGASASGKSTMRPLQRVLAERIGVDWADFALISPDIFRKYLLDYGTLGRWFRYAGMLTGEELRIVDQKLDRYMAEKARRGRMSHLLIDRFRFDSFAPQSEEQGSNLLTRFGSEIFMFFLVTPPDETVERAWERGLRVGRYKTVDDLLYHNVEAFSGMPDLFFTWALREDKTVRYEFLDNGVSQGERPRTIAFGEKGSLTVLDVAAMLDIDRYRRIDVDAHAPDAVYADAGPVPPERNLGFIRRCIEGLPRVDFADRDTGAVYLEVTHGEPVVVCEAALGAARTGPATGAALDALFPDLRGGSPSPARAGERASRTTSRILDPRAALTLGRWADAAAARGERGDPGGAA